VAASRATSCAIEPRSARTYTTSLPTTASPGTSPGVMLDGDALSDHVVLPELASSATTSSPPFLAT
jgi:hypothetical protein